MIPWMAAVVPEMFAMEALGLTLLPGVRLRFPDAAK
jgi:hypothetical protein